MTNTFVSREYFDVPLLATKLMEAFVEARKNKRNTYNEWAFEKYALLYIWDLVHEINNRTYRPGSSRAFIIRDPVIREIFAADFRDRLVHHLLFNMTADWWQRHFIYDSYACQKGKGTLFGVRRMYKAMAKASKNFKSEVWVCKLDLQGYFMSLPRTKIYERALWGLGQQYEKDSLEYSLCKFLWKVVIFDDPTKNVRIKGSLEEWNDLPDSKSLFYAPKGCGIVIGNLTSQLLSNIYMDVVDRFIVFDLGCKYYGRYVDDFWMMGEKDELLAHVDKIRDYVASLGLKLHPKKVHLQPAERGVSFLGAVIYPHRIVPGKRIKAGINRATAKLVADEEGAWDTLQSYLGLSMHFRSAKVWERALKHTSLDGIAN
ncbi:RNA-directed DNA polymerase [Candidatus Saccharibacteria bacterium]|nr:RNA-directed DNA polymerase [Candidatus Saccharibacteria bacterium]